MGPPYYESIEVNGIVFDVGARGFTITLDSFSSIPQTLTISGVGIANNSGITQNFVTNGATRGGSSLCAAPPTLAEFVATYPSTPYWAETMRLWTKMARRC